MTKAKLIEYVEKTYNSSPEYLWQNDTTSAVFRHKENNKWFGALMKVSGIAQDLSGKQDILVVKTDPNLRTALLQKRGVYMAYHMNKAHWITCVLCQISDEDLMTLLDISFELTKSKRA